MLDNPSPLVRPLADVLDKTLDVAEAVAVSREAGPYGVPTGFADLDDLLNGLWPGHLTVIGGRPGAGASTLALDIVRRAAVHNNLTTLYFRPDTTAEEVTFRLLSAESKVPHNHIRNGLMSDSSWTSLGETMGRVSNSPILIADDPYLTVEKIGAAIEDTSEHDLKLVVVDELQTLVQTRTRENRYQEVRDDVHALKRLARQHNVALVVVSKLNRSPMTRQSPILARPMLHDLRDAGGIEDVADEVILIHRDDQYEKESIRPGEADLIVAKHRNGAERELVVAFQGHYCRFVDMAN